MAGLREWTLASRSEQHDGDREADEEEDGIDGRHWSKHQQHGSCERVLVVFGRDLCFCNVYVME